MNSTKLCQIHFYHVILSWIRKNLEKSFDWFIKYWVNTIYERPVWKIEIFYFSLNIFKIPRYLFLTLFDDFFNKISLVSRFRSVSVELSTRQFKYIYYDCLQMFTVAKCSRPEISNSSKICRFHPKFGHSIHMSWKICNKLHFLRIIFLRTE